jgi:UDP-N-acetylmuramoyl-L-alanyl-D-glutamate--2,6-diaminopimelate ligase
LPKLSDLLIPNLARDPEITGLSADSRKIGPGFLFAALPGVKADGRSYIPDALARGAVAVLAPPGTALADDRALLLTDDNPRRRFALMAARFHAHQPKTLVAVTGTNGKTSVVNFTRQIWAHLGLPAASLGTIGVIAPGRHEAGSMTTPDPVELHRILDQLAAEGVTHTAFEASSHGLDQYRLDGARLSACAFTNLTRDHLDYHGDMDAYLLAKSRLFSELLPAGGAAVINADSPNAGPLLSLCRARGHRLLRFGTQSGEVRIARIQPSTDGQDLELFVFERFYQLHLPLAGQFQAWNAACALGLVLAGDVDANRAVEALVHLEGVPGRLQKVAGTPVGSSVYVDYAHTPDGLETALKAIRPHVSGRLLLVFGCGGDRDKGKRPMMGRIAADLADIAIVTDDNPRTEKAADIRSEILAACSGATEIGDRHEAIRRAVSQLRAGDVLMIAGKGHENGQIVGNKILPFDDAEEARRAVEDLA